jgi:hypothetical protein
MVNTKSEQSESHKGDGVWQIICQTSRPFCFVSYPRKDPVDGSRLGEILIRLLSQREQDFCAYYAHEFARNHMKAEEGAGYEDVYRNAASLEVIQRACLSAERFREKGEYRPFFPPVAVLRDKITNDELQYLVGAYLALQSEKGAIRSEVTDEEVDMWSVLLTTEGATCIAGLNHDGVASLLVAMARRIENLELANVGTP